MRNAKENKKPKLGQFFDKDDLKRFRTISENMIWKDTFSNSILKGLVFSEITIKCPDDYSRVIYVRRKMNNSKYIVFMKEIFTSDQINDELESDQYFDHS